MPASIGRRVPSCHGRVEFALDSARQRGSRVRGKDIHVSLVIRRGLERWRGARLHESGRAPPRVRRVAAGVPRHPNAQRAGGRQAAVRSAAGRAVRGGRGGKVPVLGPASGARASLSGGSGGRGTAGWWDPGWRRCRVVRAGAGRGALRAATGIKPAPALEPGSSQGR